MQNNASGILAIFVDDLEPYEVDLRSDTVECDLFVDYYVGFGLHNMTLTLKGPSPESIVVGEGGSTQPVLHLTDITYVAACNPMAIANYDVFLVGIDTGFPG